MSRTLLFFSKKRRRNDVFIFLNKNAPIKNDAINSNKQSRSALKRGTSHVDAIWCKKRHHFSCNTRNTRATRSSPNGEGSKPWSSAHLDEGWGERGAHVHFEEGARPLATPQFHFLNEASQPPGRSGRLGHFVYTLVSARLQSKAHIHLINYAWDPLQPKHGSALSLTRVKMIKSPVCVCCWLPVARTTAFFFLIIRLYFYAIYTSKKITKFVSKIKYYIHLSLNRINIIQVFRFNQID